VRHSFSANTLATAARRSDLALAPEFHCIALLVDLKRHSTERGVRPRVAKYLVTNTRTLLPRACRQRNTPPVIGSVGCQHANRRIAMKAVKVVIAVTIAALLSGCVVYPIGYGYRGGYYGGGYYGHHHRW
jgi:hypothetical protein